MAPSEPPGVSLSGPSFGPSFVWVAGVVTGRTYAALSSYTQPLTLHALDDPAAPPIVIPPAGNDVVLAMAGDRVIVARFDRDRIRPRTLRAWTLAGDPAGPSVTGPAGYGSDVARLRPRPRRSIKSLFSGLGSCARERLTLRTVQNLVTSIRALTGRRS